MFEGSEAKMFKDMDNRMKSGQVAGKGK